MVNENKNMLIKEIKDYQVGETADSFLLVKKAEYKTTSVGNKYCDLLLCDKTGEINAKIWEVTPELEEVLVTNTIIKVRAGVREWNGRLQLNIDRIRAVEEADQVQIEDFVPSAPYEPEIMFDHILEFVGKMRSDGIRSLLNRLLDDYKEKLMYYPAAMRNHHSIRSGWLYHILTLLQLSEKVSEVYTFLNKDLLFGGIILHDIAKLVEMDSNELGIVSDYTVEGNLLGHIVQGVILVENVAKEVNIEQEELLLLQHIILSHHYKGEWGSPKSPQIPEAEIIHHLDMIDANMYDMKMALDQVNAGEMTEKIWTLNRKLYKAKL